MLLGMLGGGCGTVVLVEGELEILDQVQGRLVVGQPAHLDRMVNQPRRPGRPALHLGLQVSTSQKTSFWARSRNRRCTTAISVNGDQRHHHDQPPR